METNFDFNMFHLLVLGLAVFLYAAFDPKAYMDKVDAWFRKWEK